MSQGLGRAMGLDVGERRIGVALADELGLIASPLTTVSRGEGDLQEIRELARDKGASALVIGLPTGLSGREGPQAVAVRAFADALRAAVGPRLKVEFWDERLTTAVAERALRAGAGRRSRRKVEKGQIDAMAAAVILQGYLDARRTRMAQQGKPDGDDAL